MKKTKKTSKKLLDTIPFFHFKDTIAFQEFLRNDYVKGSEKIDYVDIGGILYSMEEYDFYGKTISYFNKRTGLGFQIETSDRYSPIGFTDAEVSDEYEVGCYRNDISYVD